MQTFAALLDEFAMTESGSSGFQEFDAGVAGGEHGDVHFFVRRRFRGSDLASRVGLVERQRFVEGADRDAEVIDGRGSAFGVGAMRRRDREACEELRIARQRSDSDRAPSMATVRTTGREANVGS